MVIISITADTSLITSTSAGVHRSRAYAAHVDGYHIVTISRGRAVYASQAPWINGSLYVSGGALMTFAWIRACVHTIKLVRRLKVSSPNIIVTCQDPYFTGLCALVVTLCTSAALHVQVQDDIYGPYFPKTRRGNRVRRFIAGKVLRVADRIRCASGRITASLVRTGISHARIDTVAIVPVMHHLSAIPPVRVSSSDRPISILLVAPYEYESNIETAIRAFALAFRTYPHSHLHIVGSGSKKSHLQLVVRSLRLGGSVTFHDHNAHDSAERYFHHADLFLNAAYAEGFSTGTFEAAMNWVSVVSGRIGCIGYEISESGIFLIPTPSVKATAGALELALAHRQIWVTKVAIAQTQAARIAAEAEHSVAAIMKSWRQALESHIHSKSA